MVSLPRSPGARCGVVAARTGAHHHGDQAAAPGMLDFAVNVRAASPPSRLVEGLSARLDTVTHVVLEAPFTLSGAAVPDVADLVVIGNPANPTCVGHTREEILALGAAMATGLVKAGFPVVDGRAPFVDLGGECLRAAVRPEWPTSVDALQEATR